MKFILRVSAFFFPIIILIGCVFILWKVNIGAFIFSIIFPLVITFNVLVLLLLIFKRSRLFWLPLLGVVIFTLCFDSFVQLNLVSNEEHKESLSLLTYNTEGFLSEIIDDEIVIFLESKDPDIVLFQEFSAIKYKLFRKNYPYWVKTNLIAPNKSVLAVFSKHPILKEEVIYFPDSKNNAIYVDVLFDNQTIRIYNLHLESFKLPVKKKLSEYNSQDIYGKINKGKEKQKQQVQIILDHIEKFEGKVIVTGDFNSTQFSKTYRSLKRNRNDTFLEKGFGLGSTYSLFGYPLRLDFILVDKGFEVLSHENFHLGLSDHEPVMAKLKL